MVKYILDKKTLKGSKNLDLLADRRVNPEVLFLQEQLQYPNILKEPGGSQKHLFPPTSSSEPI